MTVYDLPPTALQECTFTLDDGTVSSRSGGGRINVTNVSDPTWRVNIVSQPLDQAGRQAWTSWKAKLKGGLNSFSAFDLSRRTPLNYRTARAPADIAAGWNGLGTVASVGVGGALSISGLPAGYVAKAGDRIGLEKDGWVGYHEIDEDSAASAGGVLALSLSPYIMSYFPAGSVARIWQPKALFMIDWTSWDLTAISNPTPATFNGWQVLR